MATAWRVTTTKDENLNDSDKLFTVPASTEWQILSIWVEYTSSATIGARQLEIQLQDNVGSVIAQWQAGMGQDSSLTYKYLFGIAIPDLLYLRDTGYLMTPIIGMTFLAAGQKIRVWDNKAKDVAVDDMLVRIEHAYRDI